MKAKLFFILVLGLSFIGCSVEPIEEQITEDQVNSFNSHTSEIDYGCAGPDNSKTLTVSEASSIESWDEVRKLYLSLLPSGVSRNGTFDPTIWDFIDAFNEAENPIGLYTTIYTISSENCSDSVALTIEVIPDPVSDPTCDVEAGQNASKSIPYTEAKFIESWDEVRKLYLSLLDDGVSRTGTFDPSIWDLINAFNDAENPIGEYTTTYTVTEGDCSDSVELTIIVVPDRADPPVCELDAGPNNSKVMTVSQAAAIPSWDEVRKLYLSLLQSGVSRNGTFDPSIWDLIDAFNATDNPVGEYTTTYTITNGDCSDSVELTIRVVPD